MDLRLAILGINPAWQLVLEQIGTDYQAVQTNEISAAKFAVLIVEDLGSARQQVQKFLEAGGNILFSAAAFSQFYTRKMRSKRVRTLYASPENFFGKLAPLDLVGKLSLPSSTKGLTCQNKGLQIYHGSEKAGQYFILPFDLSQEMQAYRGQRKKFVAARRELPSEIVAANSKAAIRELITRLLQELYAERELPFIQKSYIPAAQRNFCFRVDTDFCSAAEAETLYAICQKHQISASWFVDTKNIKRLQNCYGKFKDQEIALHCFRHRVFDDYQANFENLQNGLINLAIIPEHSAGFAAPFGSWNFALDRALNQLSFSYSSEFVLSYDDLPFYPLVSGNSSQVLQIPLHPISLGRLRRSHFSPTEMLEYYKNIVSQKAANAEPIIIYHHPHHAHLEVFSHLFEFLDEQQIDNLTLADYADFWRKRLDYPLHAKFVDKQILLENPDENIELRIFYRGKLALSKNTKQIKLETLDFRDLVDKRNQHDQLARRYHWRDTLYAYESWRGRRNR
ncbi:MAG: hypothetical protein R6U84_09095 [Candidatus Cloacimonadales bacterium]